MENLKIIAKTFSGLEPILANEVKKIGGKNVSVGRRAVFYEGNLELIYKSNYLLRTALRILQEIRQFQFKNVDQFYLRIKRIDWTKYFGVDQSFVINSTVANSKEFRNSMFASLKTKDAIADFFREKTGHRPNVDTSNPEIVINIHIFSDKCTVSLDSSGESLHKRGYRINQGEAPLNEVLAAAMIMLSGWNGKTDFIDPMCGSGTLPIEAAMIAQGIPPGKFRKDYACLNWNNFNQEIFTNATSFEGKKEFNNKIYASDISASNILKAQNNARRALVYNKITFRTCNFKDLNIPAKNATIMINPPYGERLQINDIPGFYSMIGERLKHQFAGNTAWLLSTAKENLKNIGLKASEKMELFNGPIKCSFNRYDLFSGKLKN